MIYILRRSVAKFVLWKKKKQNLPKIHPVLPNNNIQNNFNNAALNSEIITFKTSLLTILFAPFLSLPAIYFYYFTKNRPEWTEFQYYLMDFSVHIVTSIVTPCIIYGQNVRIRIYVKKSLKELFMF